MNKQKSAGVVAMIIAVVAITGAFAGSNHASEGFRAEPNAALPTATPPTEKAVDKVVATCNTAKGCEALKPACESLKKHSFKATDAGGKLGVCIVQAFKTKMTFYLKNSNALKQPPKTPAADVGLAAPKNTSEATLYCHGSVICRKVKNICAALGGNYTPIYDLSGSCSY